jgi:hypothetical protein
LSAVRTVSLSSASVARPRTGSAGAQITLLGGFIGFFLIARLIYQLFQSEYDSSFLDEALVAAMGLFAPIGVLRITKTSKGLGFLLAAMAYFSVVLASSLLHDYSFERGRRVFYIGLILDLKLFVLFFGAYALAIADAQRGRSGASIRFIMLILIVVALANSLQVLRDILGNGVSLDGTDLRMRGPFYRPNGFFHHPVASAQVTLLGLIASLGFLAKKPSAGRLFTALFLLAILMLNISVKEIIVGFLAVAMFVLIYVRNDLVTKAMAVFAGLACLAVIVVSPVGDQITDRVAYYTGDEGADTVRRVLYRGGFEIAREMAPLGSGTSTFASEGSRIDGYSSLYFSHGVFGRWGASYGNDQFLLDAYWPKIMAEAGFFGMAFFLLTILIPLACSLRLLRAGRQAEDFVLFSAMGGILVISIASPALSEEFTGVIFYVFSALAIARIAARFDPYGGRRTGRSAVVRPVGRGGRRIAGPPTPRDRLPATSGRHP